jgi:hypothetical protein
MPPAAVHSPAPPALQEAAVEGTQAGRGRHQVLPGVRRRRRSRPLWSQSWCLSQVRGGREGPGSCDPNTTQGSELCCSLVSRRSAANSVGVDVRWCTHQLAWADLGPTSSQQTWRCGWWVCKARGP